MPEGPVWEVVGGGENGGIVVRSGQSVTSQTQTERLFTGSLVRELQLIGDRLQYQRLTGGGPDTGWVSTNLKGKALLVKSDKDPGEAVSGAKDTVDSSPAEAAAPAPAESVAPAPKASAPWGSNVLVVDSDEEEEEVEVEEVTAGATAEDLARVLTQERKARVKLEKQMNKLLHSVQALQSSGMGWQLGSRLPQIHPSAWIAPGAAIIGTVNVQKDASIWFNCTLRGDNEIITIGEGSDIQDNSILHCDPGKPLTIGKNCLVGHQVCLHGCKIGDNCLIGMRSVILDEAKVGKNCFVAAGSQIPEKKVIPDNSFVQGNPCKVAELEKIMPGGVQVVQGAASGYVQNKNRFKSELEPSSSSAFCMVCT